MSRRRTGHPTASPPVRPSRCARSLEGLLGAERVLARAIDLIAYACDASPYRRLPQVVVMAHDAADVGKVIAYARERGLAVNFRGGGTSLSGQGQTDGIMIDVRRWFSRVRIEDGGRRARIRAGTLVGLANRLLERHGFKLGPDPASKDIATLGGVIANNSGGMRCGVSWDPYSTVESMTLVLASGAVLDTAAPDAEERFATAEPALARGLLELREQLLADEELAARVTRKYEIKNVTGYRLCAFLDADTPLEIFRRLVVGSEGTLAFIAEAVMRTRPEPARTTFAWVHFPSLTAAAAAVPGMVEAGSRATELMVAAGLIAAAWTMPDAPAYWREASARVGGVDGGVRRRGRRAAQRGRGRGAQIPLGTRADPRARVHPRRTGDRVRVGGARGAVRDRGAPASARHGADLRGRLRETRAGRGVHARVAGAARQARVPHRSGGPRLRGQPALPAHPRLHQAR